MTSRGRDEDHTEKTDGESGDRGGRGGHPVIMRINGKNRREGGEGCGVWKMYDRERWRERAGEEKGRHALKTSDAYIFKCTNCFQVLNAQ